MGFSACCDLAGNCVNQTKGGNMKKLFLALLCVGCFSQAQADVVQLSAVPTNWRLENYPGDGVHLFFTPSPCTSGYMSLPSTMTSADRNRFWALVLAAKLSQKPIFVLYDNQSPGCTIVSFGMDG